MVQASILDRAEKITLHAHADMEDFPAIPQIHKDPLNEALGGVEVPNVPPGKATEGLIVMVEEKGKRVLIAATQSLDCLQIDICSLVGHISDDERWMMNIVS